MRLRAVPQPRTTCQELVKRAERQVAHVLGMPISLAIRGEYADPSATEAAWSQVLCELRWVERMFSTYRRDSDISRLSRGEITLADCPSEVREVMELAEQAESASAGAFGAWQDYPDGRRLDPGRVVKGWALERAARHLRALPGTDFAISAGGDLVCHTAFRDSRPWQIAIEDPFVAGQLIATVPVRRGAVATSGTAPEGAPVRHARTGRKPTTVAQVTVVGANLSQAEIDATSAHAMDAGASSWLRQQAGRSGIVVWQDGAQEVISPRQAQLISVG